jgi:DNA topoisomerase-6 subunit B
MKEGINVHRFANRIPMLFQPGSDLTVKACTAGAPKGVNWKQYKIDKNTHKIGVYVSICSTKIPYGGPNKVWLPFFFCAQNLQIRALKIAS